MNHINYNGSIIPVLQYIPGARIETARVTITGRDVLKYEAQENSRESEREFNASDAWELIRIERMKREKEEWNKQQEEAKEKEIERVRAQLLTDKIEVVRGSEYLDNHIIFARAGKWYYKINYNRIAKGDLNKPSKSDIRRNIELTLKPLKSRVDLERIITEATADLEEQGLIDNTEKIKVRHLLIECGMNSMGQMEVKDGKAKIKAAHGITFENVNLENGLYKVTYCNKTSVYYEKIDESEIDKRYDGVEAIASDNTPVDLILSGKSCTLMLSDGMAKIGDLTQTTDYHGEALRIAICKDAVKIAVSKSKFMGNSHLTSQYDKKGNLIMINVAQEITED